MFVYGPLPTPQDKIFGGMISRDQVADVVVAALFIHDSSHKTVEIVAKANAPEVHIEDLFASV